MCRAVDIATMKQKIAAARKAGELLAVRLFFGRAFSKAAASCRIEIRVIVGRREIELVALRVEDLRTRQTSAKTGHVAVADTPAWPSFARIRSRLSTPRRSSG